MASYTTPKNITSITSKKRMGTLPNLCGVLAKSKEGESLGGRAGLTEDLIKKLTNFYGLALRSNTEVDDKQ